MQPLSTNSLPDLPVDQLTFGFHESQNLFDYLDAWSGDEGFQPKPASQPTEHEPGSPEKVAVLAQRLQNNEELWHPDDKPMTQPRSPMELPF